ncbi:MAG: class I SAM-dependent methyltransferase [Caldilineaceae bacterium]
MTEDKAVPNVLPTYAEARSVLDPLLSAAQLLGLLQGTSRSGLLAAARTPASAAQLAAVTGIAESQVVNLCHALEAHAVLIQNAGHYRLADPWLVLTTPNGPFPLENSLALTFAQMKILTNAAAGDEDYWALTSDDRLAIAIGITPNPASPQVQDMVAKAYKEHLPEIDQIFSEGGHCLELGCGVASALLSYLQVHPKLTAVGVELAADLVAMARQRALDLGVSDRVRFIAGDACDFSAPAQFDAVFWSQSFFPTAVRAAALQVAYQSLKPGGFLVAAMQKHEPTDQLHTQAGREYTMLRLIRNGLGVPDVGVEALRQEIEAAGFMETKIITQLAPWRVLARRSETTQSVTR